MFQPLSKYLSQFKQLNIPSIGSFELIEQSASVDITDKMAYPPLCKVQFSHEDLVQQHQLTYLCKHLSADEAMVQEQLENFGRKLKTQIQKEPFCWKGIGQLQRSETSIFFLPENQLALQPVPAHKIIRQHALHSILQGENEIQSTTEKNEEPVVKSKVAVTSIIAWILILLSIAFIVFYLYQYQFNPRASGTHFKIQPAETAPTYK